jgi:hypothetical protein
MLSIVLVKINIISYHFIEADGNNPQLVADGDSLNLDWQMVVTVSAAMSKSGRW